MKSITIGTDIIEIERIQKATQSEHFCSRMYSAQELEYYESHGKKAETLAGMFCAKEAAAKALGRGFVGFALADIQVFHTDMGMPYLVFTRGAKVAFDGYECSLSISHCNLYATAVCLLYKK